MEHLSPAVVKLMGFCFFLGSFSTLFILVVLDMVRVMRSNAQDENDTTPPAV